MATALSQYAASMNRHIQRSMARIASSSRPCSSFRSSSATSCLSSSVRTPCYSVRRSHWTQLSAQHVKRQRSMAELGSKIEATQAQDLEKVIARLPATSREKLVDAMFGSLPAEERLEAERVFASIDVNKDGVVCAKEFAAWHAGKINAACVDPPTPQQLWLLGLRSMVPMIGFGFADNFLMIAAGESIDSAIGASFHLSTMAAAGLGNWFSDTIGLGLSNTIEAMASRLGIPEAGLSQEQLLLPQARRVMAAASMLGITIGCFLGMVPLLFYDADRKELAKLFSRLDTDKDGRVSGADLLTFHQRLPFDVTQDQLAQALEARTIHHDTMLDLDSFCKLFRQLERAL
eukprot:m.64991 g.64991  ORF g.64991 m.64991 type:complete len:347 (-) comp13518_c0_seq1:705-1745(-)